MGIGLGGEKLQATSAKAQDAAGRVLCQANTDSVTDHPCGSGGSGFSAGQCQEISTDDGSGDPRGWRPGGRIFAIGRLWV